MTNPTRFYFGLSGADAMANPLAWTKPPASIQPYRELIRHMIENDEPCQSPHCGMSMLGHLIIGSDRKLIDLVRAEDPHQPSFPSEAKDKPKHPDIAECELPEPTSVRRGALAVCACGRRFIAVNHPRAAWIPTVMNGMDR